MGELTQDMLRQAILISGKLKAASLLKVTLPFLAGGGSISIIKDGFLTMPFDKNKLAIMWHPSLCNGGLS